MATPAALSWRTIANRRRVSSSVSEEVGSSSASSRTPARSARMISTSWRCAAPRSPARVQGERLSRSPNRSNSARVRRTRSRRSRNTPAVRRRSPMKRFSATDRSGAMSGSWWMTRTPSAWASAARRRSCTTPSKARLPVSGDTTPSTIRIMVDLPAPFSPTRARTSPARMSRSTSDSAWTTPKRLDTPRRARKRTGARRRAWQVWPSCRQPNLSGGCDGAATCGRSCPCTARSCRR